MTFLHVITFQINACVDTLFGRCLIDQIVRGSSPGRCGFSYVRVPFFCSKVQTYRCLWSGIFCAIEEQFLFFCYAPCVETTSTGKLQGSPHSFRSSYRRFDFQKASRFSFFCRPMLSFSAHFSWARCVSYFTTQTGYPDLIRLFCTAVLYCRT